MVFEGVNSVTGWFTGTKRVWNSAKSFLSGAVFEEYVKSTVNPVKYCTNYVFLPESTYFVQ